MWFAICDDDQEVINKFEEYFEMNPVFKAEYDCFNSGDEILKYIELTNQRYDVYFLDIEMEGRSGMDIAKQIRENDTEALIIFVSSYSEFMEEAFEVLAFRFLCKPLKFEKFCDVLYDIKRYIHKRKCKFLFQYDKLQYSINTNEIMYFEKQGKILYINTTKAQFKCYQSLSSLMKKLDASLFVKIYSSIVVNMDFIKKIDGDSVYLDDDKVLPLSRRCKSNFKEKYLHYAKDKVRYW